MCTWELEKLTKGSVDIMNGKIRRVFTIGYPTENHMLKAKPNVYGENQVKNKSGSKYLHLNTIPGVKI